MDILSLTSLGLTESQAKAYITLIQHGSITAPALALKIQETRTNAYKILDKLTDLGLAKKDESAKKIIYRAANPVALETLAIKERNEVLAREKQVRNAMPTLLNYFYTFSEQPGVRFFHGEDGLHELLNDILRVRKDVYVLRSPADGPFLGKDFFPSYQAKRAKLGIHTHIFLQDNPYSRAYSHQHDERLLIERAWLPSGDYNAAVEWDVYGDKVAIISYGQEAIGVMIESPQIAESFRQIFALLKQANYHAASSKRSNTAVS